MLQMNKKRPTYLCYYLAAILMFFASHIYAQPVAQDVLDDVIFSSSDYTGIIKIKFRMPVRYISHHPKQHGDEIRIKIDIHNILENNRNGNERESLIPRHSESYGLEEILYEKTDKDHYLTLYFKKDVSFEIIQDASHRSLSLLIHNIK
jgi:hypothetical protein